MIEYWINTYMINNNMDLQMNNKNNKEYISILILCIVGCVFVLLFSYSTSPIYRDFYIEDSAIFLTFGKFWSQGLVPYRDMFDHKGPIIYLVNMLQVQLRHLMPPPLLPGYSDDLPAERISAG